MASIWTQIKTPRFSSTLTIGDEGAMKARNDLVDNCANLWIREHLTEASFGTEARTIE